MQNIAKNAQKLKKSERVKIILDVLNKQYPKTPVPLNHKDEFTLLIAVLLSAQCTDIRVNEVTPILFKKASNPKKMALLSQKEIYSIIKPCGLGPQKSKAIKNLSKINALIAKMLLSGLGTVFNLCTGGIPEYMK